MSINHYHVTIAVVLTTIVFWMIYSFWFTPEERNSRADKKLQDKRMRSWLELTGIPARNEVCEAIIAHGFPNTVTIVKNRDNWVSINVDGKELYVVQVFPMTTPPLFILMGGRRKISECGFEQDDLQSLVLCLETWIREDEWPETASA